MFSDKSTSVTTRIADWSSKNINTSGKGMRILYFGNCQLGCCHEATKSMSSYESVYIANYEAIDSGAKTIDKNLLEAIEKADIVVYQPLGEKWGAYSTLSEYLKGIGKPCGFFIHIY